MGLLTNVSAAAAAHLVARDRDGRMVFTCVVKTEHTWRPDGRVDPVAPAPVRAQDALDTDAPDAAPAVSHPAELGPRKARLDVLLVGTMLTRSPVEAIDATLTVGSRLRKTLRVFGDRAWVRGVRGDFQPTRPRPFTHMPIAWGRAFGGVDPANPAQAELRNPAGVGMISDVRAVAGTRLPNFEDPRDPITSPKSRPVPAGFGAIAAHWLPRARLAGTFDQRWSDSRRPLLPEDFDPLFYNVAPADQQLDGFVAGEEVRLTNLTQSGYDRFLLPDTAVPIIFVTDKAVIHTRAVVDTVLIDPEQRRLSVISRAQLVPEPSPLSLRNVIVGEPSRGLRRAIATGKRHVGRAPQS